MSENYEELCLHWFSYCIIEIKKINEYQNMKFKNKSISIKFFSKIHCQKSLPLDFEIPCHWYKFLLSNFSKAKTKFLIIKCMFYGHCTTEHEENVV